MDKILADFEIENKILAIMYIMKLRWEGWQGVRRISNANFIFLAKSVTPKVLQHGLF